MHRQQQLFCVIAILFSILGCFLILVVNIKTAELNDNRLLVLNQISQLEEENRQLRLDLLENQSLAIIDDIAVNQLDMSLPKRVIPLYFKKRASQ